MSSATTSEEQLADDLLCRLLRGESIAWPYAEISDFDAVFVRRARHHGVQALVFDKISKKVEFDQWAINIRTLLLGTIRAGAVFDLLRSEEESVLFDALAKQGVTALLTKGAAISRTHYSDPRLRERCDTDLFINLEDINKVRYVLDDLGYKVTGPIYKSHQFGASKKAGHNSVAAFDVHWRILNSPRFARVISYREALDQSVPIPGLAGVRTLDQVRALLLACMHRKGSDFHNENRLIWLYDIHMLIQNMTPGELKRFAKMAVEKNVQSACRSGVLKARELFHSVVPQEVLHELSRPELPDRFGQRFARSYLGLVVGDLRFLPGVTAKLSLIGELFFPSGDLLLKKYDKENRSWLPLLWIRQISSGLVRRLTLR